MKYLKVFDRNPDLEHEFGTYIKLTGDKSKLANGAFNTGDERDYDQSASIRHPNRSRHSWVQTAEDGLMQTDRDRGKEPIKRGYSALGYVKPGSAEWRARYAGSDYDTVAHQKKSEEEEGWQKFPIMSLLGPGYQGTYRGTSFYNDPSQPYSHDSARYMSKLTKGELQKGEEGQMYEQASEHGASPDVAKHRLLGALRQYYGDPDNRALRDMKSRQVGLGDKALVLLDSDSPVTYDDIKTGEWDPQRDRTEEAQLKRMRVLGEVPVWKYVKGELPSALSELEKVRAAPETWEGVRKSDEVKALIPQVCENLISEMQQRQAELDKRYDIDEISYAEYMEAQPRADMVAEELRDEAERDGLPELAKAYDIWSRALVGAGPEALVGGNDWRTYLENGPQEFDRSRATQTLLEDYAGRDGLERTTPAQKRVLAEAVAGAVEREWNQTPADERDRKDWTDTPLDGVAETTGLPDALVRAAWPGVSTEQYLEYLSDDSADVRGYRLDWEGLLKGEFDYDNPDVASDERVKWLEGMKKVDGNKKKNMLAKQISTLRY